MFNKLSLSNTLNLTCSLIAPLWINHCSPIHVKRSINQQISVCESVPSLPFQRIMCHQGSPINSSCLKHHQVSCPENTGTYNSTQWMIRMILLQPAGGRRSLTALLIWAEMIYTRWKRLGVVAWSRGTERNAEKSQETKTKIKQMEGSYQTVRELRRKADINKPLLCRRTEPCWGEKDNLRGKMWIRLSIQQHNKQTKQEDRFNTTVVIQGKTVTYCWSGGRAAPAPIFTLFHPLIDEISHTNF